ncbi:hypothetical protein GQ600_3476 [Phytophthora cactorum]|nr:hypothetical protein GQ600_3476 [Phytophthora cactorum]
MNVATSSHVKLRTLALCKCLTVSAAKLWPGPKCSTARFFNDESSCNQKRHPSLLLKPFPSWAVIGQPPRQTPSTDFRAVLNRLASD